MSYPRRKDIFMAWAKAMVEGATVDKPNYSPVKSQKTGLRVSATRRRRKKRRKKVKVKDA